MELGTDWCSFLCGIFREPERKRLFNLHAWRYCLVYNDLKNMTWSQS